MSSGKHKGMITFQEMRNYCIVVRSHFANIVLVEVLGGTVTEATHILSTLEFGAPVKKDEVHWFDPRNLNSHVFMGFLYAFYPFPCSQRHNTAWMMQINEVETARSSV